MSVHIKIRSMSSNLNRKTSRINDNIKEGLRNIITKQHRSRIPIRIPIRKTIAQEKSLAIQRRIIESASSTPCKSRPEKSYGKDRTRLVSSYSKRIPKSILESEISLKYRKYKLEKINLIKQQLSFKKLYDEMRTLLEKLKDIEVKDVELNLLEANCGNGVGDTIDFRNKFETGFELSEVYPLLKADVSEIDFDELKAVHQKFMNANSEIFTLLKRLGEKAIQLYSHQTKDVDDVYVFQNILKLKTQFSEATSDSDGRLQFLEYKKEINQLKISNRELLEKLLVTEQQLATQAAANETNDVNREKSFIKIEEKLRGIIEKFQCQFTAQQLLQDKTDKEMAVLRSGLLLIEAEKSKLSMELHRCHNELEGFEQIKEALKRNIFACKKENEELKHNYAQTTAETSAKIDCIEKELLKEKEAKIKLQEELTTAKLILNEDGQKMFNMEMLLNQRSNRIRELIKSQDDVVNIKTKEIFELKEQLQTKNTMINGQCVKMLKLQRLLAVREVLLHTLKSERKEVK